MLILYTFSQFLTPLFYLFVRIGISTSSLSTLRSKNTKGFKGTQAFTTAKNGFLLLFSNSKRVVIEVDGRQHYAEGDTASPRKYAEMVAEDRRLRLLGYEVYRFSGYELDETNGQKEVRDFFEKLLTNTI
ncbi:DUF559 domain-containing protein [Nostoc sp. MS1]|uniref:DUF559 domain-containing protein n=1 Tax=Nostoc sp. MS1 TaxID=2764711 RepID=UPI001CC7D7E0|nr:DUF559 domain-containing protein [Nostoc sp. MS1]BCL40299.1 hypothetical protein NSMS1_67460 [Nostoc sp. MS1]